MSGADLSGHEISGKVLSLGSKVPDDTGPRVGDVVVVYPWPGCDQCETCSTENWQLCDELGHCTSAYVHHARDDQSTGPTTDLDPSLASFQASNQLLIKPKFHYADVTSHGESPRQSADFIALLCPPKVLSLGSKGT